MRTKEDQINAIMKMSGCKREEAIEMLEEDAAIDRGERMEWEPTVEEEKEIRKASKLSVERKPRKSNGPRERKEDPAKRAIIAQIADLFKDYDNFAVENVEKTINFTLNGEDFSINLTKHRKA